MTTIADLVAERQQLRTFLEAEEKRFADCCKPHRERVALLDQQCTALMQEQGLKSMKTEHGTAIISERSTPKIAEGKRDDYIDFCMEHWDEIGGEMLQVGAPKVDAVKGWLDRHGTLPPNVEMSTILQFSVRRA